MKHIVILGSSVAGHTLAVSLRQQDGEAKITLVSEENFPYYDRRRLLEYVVGDVKEKDLFLVPQDFYEKNAITFLKLHSVLHVSPSRKQVSLRYKEKREVVGYDLLAVCTGRRTELPDIGGINKEGVYTVDSLTDCKLLRQHLISDPVCLIGSSPYASRFARLLAAKQREVKEFVLPGEVVEFIGEGGVQALKLKEGKIIGTSLPVVFSSPAKANMDFLKESDIETSQGSIVVDAQQRTNLPGIFASGSVCSCIDRAAGDKTWEEVETESRQLAAVMLGVAAKVEA
jgi:NAD(P)H-nitrite reductase large subunit